MQREKSKEKAIYKIIIRKNAVRAFRLGADGVFSSRYFEYDATVGANLRACPCNFRLSTRGILSTVVPQYVVEKTEHENNRQMRGKC